MSKRSFSVIFMALVLVLSFSMIGVQAQDEPVATETPIVEQMGTGSLHISFWNGLTGSDGVTLNAMLAEFVQEYPDISVTTEIIPWATLYTKLQTAFVAGTPPDMFMVHASEVPMFASYELVADLSGWYGDNGGWLPVEDLSDVTYNGMIYNDTVYGIPLDNHGRGLWINRGAFENAGVDPDMEPPVGYDAWIELFQQLTLDANGNNAASPDFDADNVVQWGYTVGEWPYVNWLAGMAQHGGTLLSEDGSTATFNSEAGVTALQQAIDMVYTYHVSPPAAGFDTWQGFSAGAVAVLPTGTWFRNFAVDQTDIDGQAWPAPQFGDQPATWFGAHTFMVPSATSGEKLEAVETLIRWVSEHQVDWAASGQVPARLSAQEALDPENYPSNILLGQAFTEYGVLDAQHVAYQEIVAAIDPELSAALNGQKTAQQALDDAAVRVQQILDRS